MVAGPFMVMNFDARHPKEFSTENTLGGNFVLPRRHWSPSIRFGLLPSTATVFSVCIWRLLPLFTPSLS